ncbi:MAG: DUF4118 domain-containing protein [Lachnospiraceae bacterium]|nr:DUF4118 domain-containing protein [Lachnospiraceae bacterium]
MLKNLTGFVLGKNTDIKDHSVDIKDVVFIFATVLFATLLGIVFHRFGFSDVTVIAWYILAVQIVAVRVSGRLVNAFISLICVIVFNFFFIEPKYTLFAYDSDYIMTFAVMFIVSFLTGLLADQLRQMLRQAEADRARTQIMFDTSQLLNKAANYEEVATVTGMQLKKLIGCSIFIQLSDLEKRTQLHFPDDCEKEFEAEIEKDCIEWTLCSGKNAGRGTNVYPSAKGVYKPLAINDHTYGVIGIMSEHGLSDQLTDDIINAILSQCELAMENIRATNEKEAEKLKTQDERLRADLLRSISHDLRTPLTSISGNSGMLLQSESKLDPETTRQLYQDIYDDSQWLINLVENLLSVNRVTNGEMKLNCSDEVLDDIIDEAMHHIDRHAENHIIEVKKSEEMILVNVDVHLIIQVIINLMDNAVKYTPEGSTICLETERKDGKVIVKVSDNGHGISEEEKSHIFEMFYNGKKDISDSRRSMGMGLALCKSIIEAHGGQIWVTSNKPSGATFIFTLPESVKVGKSE